MSASPLPRPRSRSTPADVAVAGDEGEVPPRQGRPRPRPPRASGQHPWLEAGGREAGNPGPTYAFHRHNVGFMVVDELARGRVPASRRCAACGPTFQQTRLTALGMGGIGADAQRIVLVKPRTFMNDSGAAVAKACAYFGVKPAGGGRGARRTRPRRTIAACSAAETTATTGLSISPVRSAPATSPGALRHQLSGPPAGAVRLRADQLLSRLGGRRTLHWEIDRSGGRRRGAHSARPRKLPGRRCAQLLIESSRRARRERAESTRRVPTLSA